MFLLSISITPMVAIIVISRTSVNVFNISKIGVALLLLDFGRALVLPRSVP